MTTSLKIITIKNTNHRMFNVIWYYCCLQEALLKATGDPSTIWPAKMCTCTPSTWSRLILSKLLKNIETFTVFEWLINHIILNEWILNRADRMLVYFALQVVVWFHLSWHRLICEAACWSDTGADLQTVLQTSTHVDKLSGRLNPIVLGFSSSAKDGLITILMW